MMESCTCGSGLETYPVDPGNSRKYVLACDKCRCCSDWELCGEELVDWQINEGIFTTESVGSKR
jgi:hypothetical protein